MMTEPNAILPEEREGYDRFSRLVEGTNISPKTLLATDYLNHFNEIVMLFEIIPDMPECFEEILEWKPKSYKEHFEDSSVKDAALACEAYDHVPKIYKDPLEDTIRHMVELIGSCSERLRAALDSSDADGVRHICRASTTAMNIIIGMIDMIIHGDVQRFDPAKIDEIMRSE